MQGFAGYPLTSIVLKKEGKRLLEKYRNGELESKRMIQIQAEKTEKTGA